MVRAAHVICKHPAPDGLEGSSRALGRLCAAQAGRGHEVGLWFLADGRAPELSGVRVCGSPRSRLRFPVPRRLLADLTGWRPDVLHLHLPYEPAFVGLSRWARRHGIPYVAHPHGALSPGHLLDRGLVKRPYALLFERRILAHAAFVACTGDREAIERFGLDVPVEVVPNGIDLAEVPSGLDPAALGRRVPGLGNRRVFLFLGRLDRAQKGLDLLLDGASRARLDGAALVLAGPDWRGGAARLRRAARAARLPVHLLGALRGPERFEVLAGADVFLHPSRWEGLPSAVLEAAAVGLPSLLTRAADPLGRLSEAGAAHLVEAHPDAIAAGLERLHALAPAERRAMGARARQVAEEFSWERAAATLDAAYARHLPDAPRAPCATA